MEAVYLPIIIPSLALNVILIRMLIKERKEKSNFIDVYNECLEVKKDINYLNDQIKKL